MDNICKICGKDVSERAHFYKLHKIKEKDYYEKYFPRYDLLTKEKIPFISIDLYGSKDFLSKTNFRKYLESVSDIDGKNYILSILKKRKKDKNLLFSPCEFELRSIQFPSIEYINKIYGKNCFELLSQLAELDVRYNYNTEIKENNEKIEIICDTREQSVLPFSSIQLAKLDYGDYKTNSANPVVIERKSLIDLVGTISQGYERFQREIDRCVKDSGYIIVVIEEKYSNLLSFSYLPHMKRVKASESFILHRIRELLTKYPLSIQFLCVDGRRESVRVIEKIFKLKDSPSTIDLQWAYNTKKL